MSDMLADSNAWLEGQRHAHLSGLVTYKRGFDSVSISATIGKTDYDTQDSEGNLLSGQMVDFIVRPVDLGIFIEPKAGDKIQRVIGNITETYEVWTPSGQDLFSVDSYRLSMRIHTQLVSSK
jgi:hypothetical protein